MSSIDTKELIKKSYEEAANKSSEIVAKMVTELQATGLIITEEMVKTIIAPKAIEIFMTGYKFGVEGSQLTIEQINNTIEQRLSNCEADIKNILKQIINQTTDEKHS